MKKRDYYILAILICIIAYAVSHRKPDSKKNQVETKSINESHVETDFRTAESDSIDTAIKRAYKAEA